MDLEFSIRVSTPDESEGKMPPTGRGRPNSPNVSMIRGPKLSLFHFNDDFTFDEDTTQACIAEDMLGDLTLRSEVDETNDDKTPMNSSNSDGGYGSSEHSDNTIQDPADDPSQVSSIKQKGIDENNNEEPSTNKELQLTELSTGESYVSELKESDLATTTQQDSLVDCKTQDGLQRTVSTLSDDVFTETTSDETMRFSELKLSEASSMASTPGLVPRQMVL